MTDTDTLRHLLEEAQQSVFRDIVACADDARPFSELQRLSSLQSRIASALADTPPQLEWEPVPRQEFGGRLRASYSAKLGNRGELSVTSCSETDQLWVWEVCIPRGMSPTLEEAKAAAVKAWKAI